MVGFHLHFFCTAEKINFHIPIYKKQVYSKSQEDTISSVFIFFTLDERKHK